MLPAKTDPRWQEVVASTRDFGLSGLATKMLLVRVRLLTRNGENAEAIPEALDIAYEYFQENLDAAGSDIKAIFG